MKRLTVILAGLILCLGASPAFASEPAVDATQIDSCSDEFSNDMAQQHSVVVIEHFGGKPQAVHIYPNEVVYNTWIAYDATWAFINCAVG